MVLPHLDDETAYADVVAHCDEQRRAGVSRIDKLPAVAVPDAARDDFQLAEMLAPVLYCELGGNPRG